VNLDLTAKLIDTDLPPEC